MKHILITGGAGFIGVHLTRLALASGHRVSILDNLSPQVHDPALAFEAPSGARFYHGDVTARKDLEACLEGVDTVVHLAAETGTGQSMYEIDRYYRVNVQGTALLLDILANRDHSVGNIVLASSRSVYGEGAYLCRRCSPDGARRFPIARSPEQLAARQWNPACPVCGGALEPTATREDDPVSPASIYAATKLAQEDIVRIGSTAIGISHTILRFQNVFGEGQSLNNPYTGILSILSTRLRLGLRLPIFEDGEETRDFVHVSDVASAVLRFVERPSPRGVTLNVGRGEPTSILEVATLLSRLMGSDAQPEVTGEYRIGDIRHNFANVIKLKQVAGLVSTISLEEGMSRFCDWVTTQPIPHDLLEKANSELKARRLMG
jgi:dTDP-L-rhamnose 4-epimerase